MLEHYFVGPQRSIEVEPLRQKITRQSGLVRKLAEIRKQTAAVLSTGGDHLLRHLELQRKLDRRWLQGLLADVEAGRVQHVRNPARLGTARPAVRRRRKRGAKR